MQENIDFLLSTIHCEMFFAPNLVWFGGQVASVRVCWLVEAQTQVAKFDVGI